MNKEQFYNAVYNNWHGFGLVLKDQNNQVQLIKEFDTNGNDPDKIWKLLNDNKDIERYLHVRYSTKGATDETNVQPFEVYTSDTRRIFFMHNGTLHSFGPTYASNGYGKSDTQDFCEKVLSPALLRWSGERGKADFSDPEFFRLIIEKHWSSGSKGLFICNDIDPVTIGSGWSEYKHPDDSSSGVIHVSNTDYFQKVSRGPMFLKMEADKKRREEEEKKRQQENKKVVNSSDAPFREVRDNDDDFGYGDNGYGAMFNFGVKKWNPHSLSQGPLIMAAIRKVTTKFDFSDSSKAAMALRAITYDEWLKWINDEEDPYTLTALIQELCSILYEKEQEVRSLIKKDTIARRRANNQTSGVVIEMNKVKNDDSAKSA